MNEHIGAKIKSLRTQRKMTLKDLSEKTNLSIGFLSQLERGLTSIATDTLGSIADVFEVELSYFFLKPRTKKRPIIRSYEKKFLIYVHQDAFSTIYLTT
ncbi:helix-turn-helix domain-containing protein [Paraclostridium sp. AKS73]|uniref:helix-turn-helix domain-containing protein n=1 Tax=Paraclostridium sp. AKS73 TaxID=2876116 RepID=UPI002FCD1855